MLERQTEDKAKLAIDALQLSVLFLEASSSDVNENVSILHLKNCKTVVSLKRKKLQTAGDDGDDGETRETTGKRKKPDYYDDDKTIDGDDGDNDDD